MPDNSFIETINHLFGGAITTLIGAFTGRLMWHSGEVMRTFAECEDAAILSHDHIRAAAEADNVTVLSLDTHCVTMAGLPISSEGEK